MIVRHPSCGKSWKQIGNRTGHCAKCHETFEGISLFDLHIGRDEDGRPICKRPTDMSVGRKGDKKLLRLIDGTWRGPELPAEVRERWASI